jgi:hypothetical protein
MTGTSGRPWPHCNRSRRNAPKASCVPSCGTCEGTGSPCSGSCIIVLFLLCALFAPAARQAYDPIAPNFTKALKKPSAQHWLRQRRTGPGPVQPHPVRVPHLADHRVDLGGDRPCPWGADRRPDRVFRRKAGPFRPKGHRHHDRLSRDSPGDHRRHGAGRRRRECHDRHGDRFGTRLRQAGAGFGAFHQERWDTSPPPRPWEFQRGAIIFFHVLPNCFGPVIVQSTFQIATSILWAAGLGFLGLGAQPPLPEWGAILSKGRVYMRVAPHLTTYPGLAIFFMVLGFNLLGDGLRDALDPKSQEVLRGRLMDIGIPAFHNELLSRHCRREELKGWSGWSTCYRLRVWSPSSLRTTAW